MSNAPRSGGPPDEDLGLELNPGAGGGLGGPGGGGGGGPGILCVVDQCSLSLLSFIWEIVKMASYHTFVVV